MTKQNLFKLTLFLTLIFNERTRSQEISTLRMVNVVFRHGNRTPIKSAIFPTDPHVNETYYPYGPNGQLTHEGKLNAYKMGLQIRDRYNEFLNESYYVEELEALSSDTPRTQGTLQLVLAGLYPPIWPNYVEPYLMWQPIPYKVQRSEFEDDIFGFCADSPIEIPISKERKTLYEYLSRHTGRNVTNSQQVEKIYDTILVEEQMGFDIPKWVEPIWPDTLADGMVQYWIDRNNYELPRAVGFFLKKLTQESLIKADCSMYTTDKKIVLYSGHDSNIASVLGAFGAYNGRLINYTARIFIELHEIDEVFGFKVYLKNGPQATLEPITIKGCEEFCKIDDFIMITKHLYTPVPACQ